MSVLEVPFDEIRDNLSVQGPAGEGPDIIVGAHDWLGELVSNGVVLPIDLGPDADLYSDVAIDAFTYEGQLYGVPYAIENIALIRNTDLVPEAPATFEELEEVALQLQADGTVEVPLAIQQDPADPYHNYPLFSGSGGYVFGLNDDGSYNPADVGIDSEGGLAAAQNFADWSASGLVNKDVSYDVMIDSFSSGNAPFAITGPWAVGDFEDVNFVVEPIPSIDGGTPNVFVGRPGLHDLVVHRERGPREDVPARLPQHRGTPARAVRSGWASAGHDLGVRAGRHRPDHRRLRPLRPAGHPAAGHPRDGSGVGQLEGRLQPDLHRHRPDRGVHRRRGRHQRSHRRRLMTDTATRGETGRRDATGSPRGGTSPEPPDSPPPDPPAPSAPLFTPSGPRYGASSGLIIKIVLLGVLNAVVIAALPRIFAAPDYPIAIASIAALITIDIVYLSRKRWAIPAKYLLPGTLFLLVFALYPILYTVWISTTNYGTGNNLTKDQAIERIEENSVGATADAIRYDLQIIAEGDPTGELAFLLTDVDGNVFFGTETTFEAVAPDALVEDGRRLTVDGYVALNTGASNDRAAEISAVHRRGTER